MGPNIPTKVYILKFFLKKAHPGEHMYTSSSVSILKQFFKTFRAKFLENSCYKNDFFSGFREVNQFPSLPNMQDDLQKEAKAQKNIFLFSHVFVSKFPHPSPHRSSLHFPSSTLTGGNALAKSSFRWWETKQRRPPPSSFAEGEKYFIKHF